MNETSNIYNDLPVDLRKKFQIASLSDFQWDKLVSSFSVDEDSTYLDPCVGYGPGIEALLRHGVKEEQIIANDIVPENITYCRSRWPNVNYILGDLFNIKDKYDYVATNPPWGRITSHIFKHLLSLATKKCVLAGPFFYGNKFYKEAESLVSGFYHPDFEDFVKTGLSSYPYFDIICVYEFSSNNPTGLKSLLEDWVSKNNLSEFITLNKEDSLVNNLVLYQGQEYFLPINIGWHLPYIYNNMKIPNVKKLSVLGKFGKDKTYGLAFDSVDQLEKAIEFYSSAMVRKILSCGPRFANRCLRVFIY